jgi:hypothetical protein
MTRKKQTHSLPETDTKQHITEKNYTEYRNLKIQTELQKTKKKETNIWNRIHLSFIFSHIISLLYIIYICKTAFRNEFLKQTKTKNRRNKQKKPKNFLTILIIIRLKVSMTISI